jgi:hypothetical protein
LKITHLFLILIIATLTGCESTPQTTTSYADPREKRCRDLERHIIISSVPITADSHTRATAAYNYCLAGLSAPNNSPQKTSRPANVDVICTNIGNNQVRCVNK